MALIHGETSNQIKSDVSFNQVMMINNVINFFHLVQLP